jgi:hypothetical protein
VRAASRAGQAMARAMRCARVDGGGRAHGAAHERAGATLLEAAGELGAGDHADDAAVAHHGQHVLGRAEQEHRRRPQGLVRSDDHSLLGHGLLDQDVAELGLQHDRARLLGGGEPDEDGDEQQHGVHREPEAWS